MLAYQLDKRLGLTIPEGVGDVMMLVLEQLPGPAVS
jgi:hypothetical protein